MSTDEILDGSQGAYKITRNMNLCDEKLAPECSEDDKDPVVTQNPIQQTIGSVPYSAYHSDPLATDKPGDELLPEAAVWSIYKKEATEYDNELVKGRNENLDTMLIFAALFSAILTAFLIESTDLLQEDPAETSATLLLLLVQSNLGATNISSTLPEPSSFTPGSSARWVNGLWFAALGLSLAAALLAMLAKEWLDAFTTSHKRAPHAYTITRQARLDGFEAWGAPHIMDLLPTLLHLSLLLFALGLVVYLWRLDQAIAIMLSCIIGLTTLLYLGTIVCGAVYELCPYITRLSRYLQLIIQATRPTNTKYDNKDSSHEKSSSNGELTAADVRALMWLAGNARDQESSNSAYQALAGLSQRKIKRLPAHSAKHARQKMLKETYEVARFLEDFAARFWSTLTESPQELAKCRGENIIRYARALPGIVTCVDTFMGDLEEVLDEQTHDHASIKLGHTADRATALTLKVVDKIWSGQYQLNASTYAYLAASELRYVHATIANGIFHDTPEPSTWSESPTESRNAVIVLDLPKRRRAISSPTQLWARYEAKLGCASLLIYLHLQSDPTTLRPMKKQALLELLKEIETTATFMLKLATPYSEHLQGRKIHYYANASLNSSDGPAEVGMGYESSLHQLISDLLLLSSTPHLDLALAVRQASARAMLAIGLLHTQEMSQSNGLDFTWPEFGDVNERLRLYPGQSAVIKAAADLSFLVASNDPSSRLLGKTLSSQMNVIRNMDSNFSQQTLEILGSGLVPVMQLANASMSSWDEDARSSLIGVLAFKLPDRFVTSYKTTTVWANALNARVIRRHGESDFQGSVSWLLSIIQQTPNCLPEVRTLLSELIGRFNEFDGHVPGHFYRSKWALDHPYLTFFTKMLGFDEIAKVGQYDDYIPLIARTVIGLCIDSHFQQAKSMNLRESLMAKFSRVDRRDLFSKEGRQILKEYKASPLVPHPQAISPIALPGFLDAVTLALDCIQSNKLEEPMDVPEFVECALKLLNISLIASRGEFDSECGIKAGGVARRLREHGAHQLELEAAGVIVHYGQYCELPMQTEDEIAILEDQSIARMNYVLSALQTPTAE